jgi:AraC-like DNA-binding protein
MPSRIVSYTRDFQLPGVIMFGRYQLASSSRGLPPHSHRDAIEICFLERGEQSYRVKGLIHRLHGHDQFFTLPSEVHDSANLPQERGILYWLILSLKTPNLLGLAPVAARRLKAGLRGMPTRHFRAHPDCAPLLAEITTVLAGKPDRRGPAALSRPLRLQALLLSYLARTIGASHRGARGSATPLIQRVLAHLAKHLNDPIQVSRLAEVAGLSESRFKVRFKSEMGVPPAEYWLRKKIGKAIGLLEKRNVTEVAYELGFSSSQYFATAFKRYTMKNPSQFH